MHATTQQPLAPARARARLQAAEAAESRRRAQKLAQASGGSGLRARPRRVLLCCHGSRGDVQPLVALALGMQATGAYEVAFWTVR